MTRNFHFKNIYSTNTWALQNASTFPIEEMVRVTAEEQSAGRGRLNRGWESPQGTNLYLTFAFSIDEGGDLSNLPQILALATADVLETLGASIQLKWPNDLVFEGKKLGGILCETKSMEEKRFVALGIGLNVNETPADVDLATSVYEIVGKKQDLEALIVLIEEKFCMFYRTFLNDGFSPFHSSFSHRLYCPKEVVFYHNNQEVVGKIYSLNEDGSLTLQLEEGRLKTYHYGEIISA